MRDKFLCKSPLLWYFVTAAHANECGIQTETRCLVSGAQRWSFLHTVLQKFLWGSQSIVRIQYSGASWKKTQKGGKASSSLTVKSFIFSDSDILKMKGNRSHVLCGYWGVWTITVRPRLIMTLGTLRHLNLSLLSLGFPSHKDWAWIRSLALYQVGTSNAQMSQPCPASCWHSTGGAGQAPLPLGGHLVSRGYIFRTWGWNFYGPTFSDRTF